VKCAALLALLAGCISMAPTYQRPASPVKATDSVAAPMPLGAFVHEPKLRKILARVVSQNRSLRRTVLDIEAARQQYRIQRAQQLPSIDAVAAVTATSTLVGTDINQSGRFTQYSATVGLSNWEIDLFGRLKSLNEAKLQSYYAAVESAKAARISLVAETAVAYVTLAADRSRLAIAQNTMATSKKAMDLTEQLVGGGTSNRGDYWQASTVFQQARSDVALLTATIAQDKNALELLAGGPLDASLLPDALPPQLDWFADVPAGLSSKILLARPDVLAAEHDLESANANIGAARAQFFPSLSLTANGGLASIALASLFTGPASIWTIAPSLVMPLFHGGANRANLAYTKVQKEAMIAAYELAIQTAFRETADALAVRATIDEQLAAQIALVEAAQKSLDLAQARYQAGIEPFLTTLVSARALYAAQNSLVATQLAVMSNRVTLYRVLGGGLE
jgi:multidrug efflux system outer membrane protein